MPACKLDATPDSDVVEYSLDEQRAASAAGAEVEVDQSDDHSVIFCIDVSGSMGISTEVEGKIKLRGVKDPMEEFRQFMDPGDLEQMMPGQNRNVTYITRLQAMIAAVDQQIEDMSVGFPERRVGIVTFNNQVTVLGDGSKDPCLLDSDLLSDFDSLVEKGEDLAETMLSQPVSSTAANLSDRVFSLQSDGQTALGPALLLSVAMASKSPGSKVVVCTDGLANIGLGTLDNLQTEEEREAASSFYDQIGALAAESGVTVSIISIEGDECRMENLGKVSDLSGGSVNMVQPLELINEFANILALPVLASHVELKVLMHNALRLLYVSEDQGTEEEVAFTYSRRVGNVTEDTENLFEYEVLRDRLESLQKDQKCVAFQAQISYTTKAGHRFLRVYSRLQSIGRSNQAPDADVDIAMLGAYMAQNTANIAMKGDYRSAQRNATMWSDFCTELGSRRGPESEEFVERIQQTAGLLNAGLEEELSSEVADGLNVEDGDYRSVTVRSNRRSDRTANTLYQMKTCCASRFSNPGQSRFSRSSRAEPPSVSNEKKDSKTKARGEGNSRERGSEKEK